MDRSSDCVSTLASRIEKNNRLCTPYRRAPRPFPQAAYARPRQSIGKDESTELLAMSAPAGDFVYVRGARKPACWVLLPDVLEAWQVFKMAYQFIETI